MSKTIRAIELFRGDEIIGDRTYAAGTLDYRVQDVTIKYPAVEGQAIVTVKFETGRPNASIVRTIVFGGDEKVIIAF
jgi:hypothetical protein